MEKRAYEIARINRDRHFDGMFYFGVKTTGVFCRPSCPSPTANRENVSYFDSVFEALEQGFRPCMRCCPDIVTDRYHKDVVGGQLLMKALDKIYEGYLNNHSLEELAGALHISDRRLRGIFKNELGVSPIKVARFSKVLFAKKLLIQTNLSITDIAMSSGFGSIRQFNDTFKSVFNATPTEIRGQMNGGNGSKSPVMKIPYQGVYDFKAMLEFLGPRIIKEIEVVTETSYTSNFRISGYEGRFTVSHLEKERVLLVEVETDDVRALMPVYHRVSRMFDTAMEPDKIEAHLLKDVLFKNAFDEQSAPRLPIAFDPFAFTVRAILGQQISVKAATTLAGRIVKKAGIKSKYGDGYHFPDAAEILALDLSDIGITRTRQQTLRTVCAALLDNQFSLDIHQSLEGFSATFGALKGIGDWTINYIAMRGLGMSDAFPSKDLGIIRTLNRIGVMESDKEIIAMSDAWRPYRAYATLCIWQGRLERGDL
jgi:AraC family transcriptional regulator of adaptative response / DNA-3-methyladenine glycosylase II